MTAYIRMVADFARAGLGGNDDGQNLGETALIIGVISLVLVLGFMTSGITQSMTDLATKVACEIGADDANAAAACP